VAEVSGVECGGSIECGTWQKYPITGEINK